MSILIRLEMEYRSAFHWVRLPHMLVVSQRVNDSVVIDLSDDADPTMKISELFANGPIEVRVLHLTKSRFKIGIDAPAALLIRRTEGNFAEKRPLSRPIKAPTPQVT